MSESSQCTRTKRSTGPSTGGLEPSGPPAPEASNASEGRPKMLCILRVSLRYATQAEAESVLSTRDSK